MSKSTAQSIERNLRAVIAVLDPDAVPLCEVLDSWKAFNAIERLAASAKTLLARRVEDGDTWRKAGHRSAADQLAELAGSSVSDAKKSLETSKRVKKLPKSANSMRKGELSPAKAEAIVSAATVAPEAEDDLLFGAEKKPLAELREECLKAKAADRDKTHDRIRRDRFVRVYKDAEGAWNLYARGTVDDGARFMTVLEPLIDGQFKQAKAEGREEPVVAYAFDALMEMAGLCRRHGDSHCGSGCRGGQAEADPGEAPGDDPGRSRSPRPRRGRG